MFTVNRAPTLFSRFRRCCICLGLTVLSLSAAAAAAADMTSIAYRVKAGYLFNFLKFAEWPPTVLPANAPLRIDIAGDEPTYRLVADELEGKVVNDRPIVVHRSNGDERATPPHLLFITRSADPSAVQRASRLAAAPVLTVGESPDFARRHGILNFVLVDDAVRFEINLAAAEKAGLRISSRISKLAILVRP